MVESASGIALWGGFEEIELVLCRLFFLKLLERGRPIHKAVPEQ